MESLLQDGISSSARLEPAGYTSGELSPDVSGVSVAISGGGSDSYRVAIYAEIRGERCFLGAVRTIRGSDAQRVCALAAAPGAKAWEVRVSRVAPPEWSTLTQGSGKVGVTIGAAHVDPAALGVSPVLGVSEPSIVRGYAAGVAGTVVVKGRVTGWTAQNDSAVAGSAVVDGGAPRIVPATGAVIGGSLPETPWGHQFAFAGTSSYVVEYEIASTVEGA